MYIRGVKRDRKNIEEDCKEEIGVENHFKYNKPLISLLSWKLEVYLLSFYGVPANPHKITTPTK